MKIVNLAKSTKYWTLGQLQEIAGKEIIDIALPDFKICSGKELYKDIKKFCETMPRSPGILFLMDVEKCHPLVFYYLVYILVEEYKEIVFAVSWQRENWKWAKIDLIKDLVLT
jgi:hypothetical protein